MERAGRRRINAMLEMANNNTKSHISEFPIGTYRKAHRHGPGAHLVLLSGTGGALPDLDQGRSLRHDQVRIRQLGSMVTVPSDDRVHQHFNSGTTSGPCTSLRRGMGL